MYTRFYGLTKKPFENTPDPEFLYLSENHREVLASLAYGVNSAKGLILAMGDVGTGKTTLINALLKQLDPSFVIVRITNPRLVFGRSTFTNILEFFSSELGLRRDRENNRDLIEEVTKELEKLYREGRKAVLIIDEAHLLSEESLHDIRLLSNIENEKTKLIQILLVGQNELNRKLQKDTLKALKQRFNVSRMLRPLNRSETGDYILHRLHVAGRDSQIFDKRALALIFRKSSGVPRLINQMCDSSLLIGYAVGARTIGAKVVREVIDDMDTVFGSRKTPAVSLLKRWGRPAAWTVLALLIAVTVAVLLLKRPSLPRNGSKEDSARYQSSENSRKDATTGKFHSVVPPAGYGGSPEPESYPIDHERVAESKGTVQPQSSVINSGHGNEESMPLASSRGKVRAGAHLEDRTTSGAKYDANAGDLSGPLLQVANQDLLDEWFRKKDSGPGKAGTGHNAYYIVKNGDTLSKIAALKGVYNDPLKWPSLLRVNLELLGTMKTSRNFENEELPAGLRLRFITPEEAAKNLAKVNGKRWVVNVLSARTAKRVVPFAVKLIKNGYHVYLAKTDIKGDEWIRLRVGFFDTTDAASSVREKISSILDLEDSWITRITETELKTYGGY